jgi:hypothetical protein
VHKCVAGNALRAPRGCFHQLSGAVAVWVLLNNMIHTFIAKSTVLCFAHAAQRSHKVFQGRT